MKKYQIWWKFDKVLTKKKWDIFWTTLVLAMPHKAKTSLKTWLSLIEQSCKNSNRWRKYNIISFLWWY